MAFAPAAEDATFGVALLLPLFALLGLLMLRAVWAGTFGWLFHSLAGLFAFRTPGVFGFGSTQPLGAVARFLDSLNGRVYRAFGKGIAATEHAWHQLLLWTAYQLVKQADEIANLSNDLLSALRAVFHKIDHVATRTVTVTMPPRIVHIITRVIPAKPAAIVHVVSAVPALVARVGKLERAITHTAHAAVALPLPRIGRLEREAGRLAARLRRLGWIGAFAGVGALGLAILAKLGLGWARCTNVKNVGKNVCGMNPSLLDSLLADTLLIAGTVSLVEFAQGMQGIVAEIEQPIRTFWRAT